MASVTATTDPGANTTVGGSVSGHDLVQVTSTVTSDANATANAFAVSLGGAAAAVVITATNSPSVSATAKGASSSNNDVVIYAVNNYTGSVYPLGGADSFNGNGAHASTTQVDASAGLSVGASVVTAEDHSSAVAGLSGGGTSSVPNGKLVVAARSAHLAVPQILMVSVGLGASFSGIVMNLNIGGDVAAEINNGTTVNARSVNVTSVGSSTETLTSNSVGVGAVAGAFVDLELKDTSTVEAFIGPGYDGSGNPILGSALTPTSVTTTGSGGIRVTATGTSPAAINASLLGISLVASGSFTKAVATVKPTIRAFLGDHAAVHSNAGDVDFTANGAVTTLVSSTGVNIGLGAGVGADIVTADNEPTVGAYGVSNGTLTGVNLNFTTNLNQGYSGDGPAYTTVTLGSASLGVSGSAAVLTSTDSPKVTTGPGSGSANFSGTITLASNVLQHAKSNGTSFSLGIAAGIGFADTNATAGGSTTTQFGALASGVGTSFSATSNVNASSEVKGRALGVSIGGGAIVNTDATTDPTVSTAVGGSPHESGQISVTSNVTSNTVAESDAISVSLLASVALNDLHATNAPNISASLAGGTSDSGNIVISALNNYTGTLGSSDSYNGDGATANSETVSASLLAAVGATTMTAEDNSSVAAFVAGGGTASTPNGTIVIASRTSHVASPTQNAVTVGLGVAFSGQDAESKTGGTTAAYVADGATISNTKGLNISANTSNTTTVSASSVGVSTIAAAGIIAKATDTSLTEAYIGPQDAHSHNGALSDTSVTVGSGGIAVSANLSAPVSATTSLVSVGLGASGAVSDTEAHANGTVRTYLGDQAQIHDGSGTVNFAATGTITAYAVGTGFQVSGLITVGVETATADNSPTIGSYTKSGGSIDAGTLEFTTALNQSCGGGTCVGDSGAGTDTAFANAILGGASLGISITGATASATDAPTVNNVVGSTTLNGGSLTVTSDTYQSAEVDGRSLSLGLIAGVGVVQPSAEAGGTIDTGFSGSATGLSSAQVQATDVAHVIVNGRGFAFGGGGAVSAGTLNATVDPNVTTSVAGSLSASGTITIESNVTTSATAEYSAVTVSLLGAGTVDTVYATDSSHTTTDVQGSIESTLNDVRVFAYHNFNGTQFDKNDNVQAVGSSVTAALGLAMNSTNLTALAEAHDMAQLDSTGNLQAPKGEVDVDAYSSNIAISNQHNANGAILNVSVDSNPTATVDGDTEANLNGNVVGASNTTGADSLVVEANGNDTATSGMDEAGGGLLSFTDSQSTTNGTPSVSLTFGGASSNIIVTNDATGSAVSQNDSDASTSSATGGALNVSGFTATSSLSPMVDASVTGGASITSLNGSISVDASSNGPPPPVSDGTFNAGTDVSDNTVHFFCNGVPCITDATTGDTVTYDGNGSIGLTNGRTYSVIVAPSNATKFGSNAIQFGDTFGAGNVNLPMQSIDFGSRDPHLQNGDLVFYYQSGTDGTGCPTPSTPSNAPVGGLSCGTEVSGRRHDRRGDPELLRLRAEGLLRQPALPERLPGQARAGQRPARLDAGERYGQPRLRQRRPVHEQLQRR